MAPDLDRSLSRSQSIAGLEDVWTAQDTTPAAIESALRNLLRLRYAEGESSYVPARVLNFVAIADRSWRGEVANRLDRLNRYHPSRTIVCVVDPGRTTIDAMASMIPDMEASDTLLVCREGVEIHVGPEHVEHLHTIVGPVLARELPCVVWSPHGYPEALDSLLTVADVMLIDSDEDPELEAALRRSRELGDRVYVVDLAWLRTKPWRENIAASFDAPSRRREIQKISSVTVRHRQDSAAAGFLLLGWLASRLSWRTHELIHVRGAYHGYARGRRQNVAVRLEPVEEQDAPGLAGVTLETADGLELSIDRGPGGLNARRRTPAGAESEWTILRVARDEAGLFGEGVRETLLRDPTYGPALEAASAMLR